MCDTCGCVGAVKVIEINSSVREKNQQHADENRKYFKEHDIFSLNLVSSPGSGKTSLLVAAATELKKHYKIAVIEGDQQTVLDAIRIDAVGVPVIQINTGKGCHLDAHGVGHAALDLNLFDGSVLIIENVGNLVCPSAFDLGEAHKVVFLSVTEGTDKPLKYPEMFHVSNLMIINKMDLLPYVDFDVDKCIEYAQMINPDIDIILASAKTGDGLDDLFQWIAKKRKDFLKKV
jgi:hydrogenase nickel incorporation protein HypB